MLRLGRAEELDGDLEFGILGHVGSEAQFG